MNRVSMRQFGCMGRAANQFFQYSFLTNYAAEHNLTLELPPWIGNVLFGLRNEPLGGKLTRWKEPGSGLEHPSPPRGDELVNRDYFGYGQYHTKYYASDKDRVRDLFKPMREVASRVEPAEVKMRSQGQTIVGLHIRRGDYGRRIFPLTPIPWYLRWLEHHWVRFPKPKLFIATEDLSLIAAFDDYKPITATQLGISLSTMPMDHYEYLPHDRVAMEPHQLDFYPDFYLLSQCDVILGGSSTFSFFAAMLSHRLQEYWRASLAAEQFVLTDPWDAYPILREHCRDYTHLEGITSTPDNPYW